MNDLNWYMEKYLEHLAVLNFAPQTLKGHQYGLRILKGFLDEMGIVEVEKVTPETVGDYQEALGERVNPKGEPIAPGSRNHILKAARSFFRWLWEENYLLSNPARHLRNAKTPKTLPRSILTEKEVKRLLAVPDTHTALGYRDRTILELMYSTGLRKSEVNHLKVTDVDTGDGFLRVNEGKWGKDRVVPLGKIACHYVENYVKVVRPMLVKHQVHPYLFVTDRGKPCSSCVVWDLVRRHARTAGLEKRVTPHTLRHTCATLMMRNKAGIRHVQELLGHALLETTQVYTRVTVVDLKEAHKKYHPREKEGRQALYGPGAIKASTPAGGRGTDGGIV